MGQKGIDSILEMTACITHKLTVISKLKLASGIIDPIMITGCEENDSTADELCGKHKGSNTAVLAHEIDNGADSVGGITSKVGVMDLTGATCDHVTLGSFM